MYAQMVKSTGKDVVKKNDMTPKERIENRKAITLNEDLREYIPPIFAM